MNHKVIIIAAATAAISAGALHAEYTLKPNRGKMPDDVKTENLNGILPIESGYKRGWTATGWGCGDFGDHSNSLLSPSYLNEGERCENALTLPALTIEEGENLSWKARAAYPLRTETYTVECRRSEDDEWVCLGEYEEKGASWSDHILPLGELAGQTAELRFVCRSEGGYMLVLSGVTVAAPVNTKLACSNHTPKFFTPGDADADRIEVETEVINLGRELADLRLIAYSGEEPADEIVATEIWPTGETRSYTLRIPVKKNERTDYRIVAVEPDGSETVLTESFAYMTSFRRRLFVDEGTGMWCTNCPTGTLALEQLEADYGDDVIAVATHNGDPLANDNYFSWLGFYSIPRFLLNREKSTAGDGIKKFGNSICQPTEMGIEVTGAKGNADGSADITAEVATSDDFSAEGHSYTIGYTITRNVAGDENILYYQSNNCSIAAYRQFYYLPSYIPAALCNFPDVSLPSPLGTPASDPAFTGVEGSLPESLEPGTRYSATFTVPLPDGYGSFEGMRLVAFILDTTARTIINCNTAELGRVAGSESLKDASFPDSDRRIFDLQGRELTDKEAALRPGIYIKGGKKTVITR